MVLYYENLQAYRIQYTSHSISYETLNMGDALGYHCTKYTVVGWYWSLTSLEHGKWCIVHPFKNGDYVLISLPKAGWFSGNTSFVTF